MTANQFMIHCLGLNIYPDVALENDKIVSALEQRNDEEVIRLLETEF